MAKEKDEMTAAERIELARLEQEAKRLELMERQISLQEKQAAALETQTERTRPKENPNYVAKSIFLQPNGEPWAKALKCEMYFGPFHLNKDALTQAEVEALNALQPITKARITKTDRTVVMVNVNPKEDAHGRLERLTIDAPMRSDGNPHHYPPLIDLVRELVAQAPQMAAA